MSETPYPPPPELRPATSSVLKSPEGVTHEVLVPNQSLRVHPQIPLAVISPTLTQKIPAAEFTTQTAEALKRCGVNPDLFNPENPILGAGHVVFKSKPSSGGKVLKIGRTPRNIINTMTEGYEGEKANLDLAVKYFTRKYIPPTEVYKDHQLKPEFYCVVQDTISGKHLTNIIVQNNPALLSQLEEIIQMNARLYREKRITLDFIGVNGVVAWLKELFSGYVLRKRELPVSNILVDKDGNLKIIDFEFFDFSKQAGIKKKLVNWFCTTTNRILMKHYFGLDILNQATPTQEPTESI